MTDNPRHHTGTNLPAAPLPGSESVLLRAGGAFGVAAWCIGTAIFLAACCGFNGAFAFSVVPVVLSAVGLVLALAATLLQPERITAQSQVLLAFFVTITALIGSLFEMSVWLGWPTPIR